MFNAFFRRRGGARALAAKRLDILVLGAGSSLLAGPEWCHKAYPARLQMRSRKIAGHCVKVTSDVTARRTAANMAKILSPVLAVSKPALIVWQTGTVDAMQAIDTDQFKSALDSGISISPVPQALTLFSLIRNTVRVPNR